MVGLVSMDTFGALMLFLPLGTVWNTIMLHFDLKNSTIFDEVIRMMDLDFNKQQLRMQ